MEKLKLRNTNALYGREPIVMTNGLVFKSVEDTKTKKIKNVVIYGKFFCREKDANYFKQSELIFEHRKSLSTEPEIYLVPATKDFDEVKPKKSDNPKFADLVCIDLARKKEKIIRRDDEKADNNPIIAINNASYGYITQTVYNIVKDGVTTPMFPNFLEDPLLAAQLKTNIPTAKKIREILVSGAKPTKALEGKVKRAKYLLDRLEEWKVFVFEEMKKHKLLKPLQVRFNSVPFEAYEVMLDENIIEEEIISLGLRIAKLKFTDKSMSVPATDFGPFMSTYAPDMTEIIGSIAKPLFKNGQIPQEIEDFLDNMPRKPLMGQKNAIMAGLISLMMQKTVQIVGECGVGKTLMMLQMLRMLHELINKTMKTVILSPGHIVESTWVEETKADLYDVTPHVIKSITEMQDLEKAGYLDDNQHRVFIVSQETAKGGYTERPAVNWRVIPVKDENSNRVIGHRHGYTCPNCGEIVMHRIRNEKKKPTDTGWIDVPVPFDYFNNKRESNEKCKHCETPLWTPYVKAQEQDKFIYLPDPKKTSIKGFFPRDLKPIRERLKVLVHEQGAAKSPKERKSYDSKIEQFRTLEEMLKGNVDESLKQSPYKVPVSTYIAKKLKHRFTSVIIDEFHEFQGETDRTDACVELVKSVKYVVTGTGTAMNGYAKSIFRTLFMLHPEKLKKFGFTYKDEAKFQAMFGVTEKKFQLIEEKNARTGKVKEKTRLLQSNDKPGISPVIFVYFMQDTTVFLSLDDLAEDLPKLEHNVIPVGMSNELKDKKQQLENEIRLLGRTDKRLVKGALQIAYGFLDSPSVSKEIRDKDTGDLIIKTPTISLFEDNKLTALKEYCLDRVKRKDRRVMVYTYYTSDGINEYLGSQLQDEGYRVAILNTPDEKSTGVDGQEYRVKRDNREVWIKEQVKQGCDILVVGAELVKTGMNLQAFPSIIYYQMGHQLYTNRQADRRSWRVGQDKDCEITYLYYEDSLQETVASLMATKILASQSIEGNMDEAGLEAISNDRTIEEELAKRFYEGMKDTMSLKKTK